MSVVVLLCFAHQALAQSTSSNSGTVHGTVVDPAGMTVKSATVEIQNPVSKYSQTAQTDAQGNFVFNNVPFNPYHLSVSASGFAPATQDVDVRSAVPLDVKVSLKIGNVSTSVEVTADAGDLLEVDPVTHTDVDRALFDKLPLESQSSSLSSLVTLASPGIAADSNGLFHGFGDHASNSFSLDGQPITDQQSKIFSNQVPLDAVQSIEVIAGAPPAEFGDKTSVVIVATTRSGMGVMEPHGDATASFGSFGTSTEAFDLLYGHKNWGNFISVNGMNTQRFLDPPEFQELHDRGNEENLFDRLDFRFSSKDTMNLNFGYTRSWFQTPNSYDSQNATAWSGLVVDNGGLGPDGRVVGVQDQRSKIRTFNIAPSWTHVLNASSLFTFAAFARQDQFNYYPSRDPFSDLTPGGLQAETVGQNRRLTNLGLRANVSYSKGRHNLKIGALLEDTILTEGDTLGVVDPTINPVCLDSDGNAITDPGLGNPNACTGALQQNPNFNPLLACYDLTRTGRLPVSDGCPGTTSGVYTYNGHADVHQFAAYIQDSITFGNWTANLGVRGEAYNGLASKSQVEPRLGISYKVKGTNTVIRASYARTLETPFNENLIVSSLGCNDAVVNAIMSIAGPCNTSPLGPGWRNEFHVGLEQAFGRYLVFDGEYIWKYTHRAYDFSILGNTPITFPVEWNNSKIPGFAFRVTVPNYHGLSAFVVMSSVAARFFTPQVAGIGAVPGGSTVFRIDHDEKFNSTAHLQYQPFKRGPWLSFNWRYDSGLVAGAAPFAGAGDTFVDASYLTPDQQFQAGLFCGSVRATPTVAISADSSCPVKQFGSTLLQIPAAGTEDDDHNPPRIASRNLFDIAVGDDNLFHGDKRKWSLRLSVVNVTNNYALYNFLSTFSGTHYVTPRSVTGTVGFHF
ncbi:MAG TPA: TonB-dependent receptor [Bryobacteraceae bacterium]